MTRTEALNAGLKRYTTGNPCLRGHNGERFVSTGGCVACGREAQKRFQRGTMIKESGMKELNFIVHPHDEQLIRDYVAALELARIFDSGKTLRPAVEEKPTALQWTLDDIRR